MVIAENHRAVLRMAQHIERQYEQLRRGPNTAHVLSDEQWDEIRCLQQRLSLALEHGHEAVAEELGDRLRHALQNLAGELTTAAHAITRQTRRSDVPSLRLLYEELAALDHEFEHVRLDLKQQQLAVRTERIVLDDFDLGPFEIRLHIQQLGIQPPYEVIALEPHRPASNSSLTHPHVQHDHLCEGDGRQAIARALEEGRLGEFFLLVAQILQTYNADSAYCSLGAWDGSPCADCDELVDDDDLSSCDRCNCRLCDGCSRSCTRCDHVICAECSLSCESCGCRTCSGCLEGCGKCEQLHCSECLEGQLCPTCLKTSRENDHAELEDPDDAPPVTAASAPQTPAATADDPLQPLRLGQALVSA